MYSKYKKRYVLHVLLKNQNMFDNMSLQIDTLQCRLFYVTPLNTLQ